MPFPRHDPRRSRRSRRGVTLPDLITALAVMAAGFALLLPGIRDIRDRTAVRSAREAVAALVTEARWSALEAGGARVVVTPGRGTVRVAAGDSLVRSVDVTGDFGVRIVEPAGDSTVLRYGALGLGMAASSTLTLARRGDSASLVVSSYGRVVRR